MEMNELSGSVSGDLRVGGDSLTRVAQIVGIVRDLCIISAFVFSILLAGRLLQGISQVGNDTPTPEIYPCATPTTDGFGTFCPTSGSGG